MQNTIQISGLRFDYEKRLWICPKLWMHEKYGVGEMYDAFVSSDGKLWVIALDFGEEQRKIRQDKLSVYGGSVKALKLGKTLNPKKVEEIVAQALTTPISSAPKKARKISREELLRRLRE